MRQQKVPHQGAFCGAHEGVAKYIPECIHLSRQDLLPSCISKSTGESLPKHHACQLKPPDLQQQH